MIKTIAACLLAAALASPAAAQTVVRHAATPPALILQGVTVKPGAEMLYLSGQLAAPIDPTKTVAPAALTIADFGDTKT
ncbi:MAG: endonuclease, partial [Sphingomonas sp.]